MNDAEPDAALVFRFVRGVKPVERADQNRRRDLHRDVQRLLAHRPQKSRERVAMDVLHDEKDLAAGNDDVEWLDDVSGGTTKSTDVRSSPVRTSIGCASTSPLTPG